jgi:hypothetical protein
MRGVTRRSIITRKGVSEIRVERRPIERAPEPEPIVAPLAPADTFVPLGALAADIASRLRDKIRFPHEFWKEIA